MYIQRQLIKYIAKGFRKNLLRLFAVETVMGESQNIDFIVEFAMPILKIQQKYEIDTHFHTISICFILEFLLDGYQIETWQFGFE